MHRLRLGVGSGVLRRHVDQPLVDTRRLRPTDRLGEHRQQREVAKAVARRRRRRVRSRRLLCDSVEVEARRLQLLDAISLRLLQTPKQRRRAVEPIRRLARREHGVAAAATAASSGGHAANPASTPCAAAAAWAAASAWAMAARARCTRPPTWR